MDAKKIQRINELYHLEKSAGLTPQQKKEQKKLRAEYIQAVRANLRGQLNNISIQNEDGSITPLKPKGKNQTYYATMNYESIIRGGIFMLEQLGKQAKEASVILGTAGILDKNAALKKTAQELV